MPKIINPMYNDTCYLCNRQAFWISVNSKKKRCTEKITQCPGFVAKAQATRDANTTPEVRAAHMKQMSINGNAKLKELHTDINWRATKSNNISEAIALRGGMAGANNPMYGRKHSVKTKEGQAAKAKLRNPLSYTTGILTKIAKGICIPKEQKAEWELYKEKVYNITQHSWKNYQHIINPNNLPKQNIYDLDHKYSTAEGFVNHVPPNIIGHYANLELIPARDNRVKGKKCSITIEELYSAVNSK